MTQDELNAALAASPSPDCVTPEYLKSRIADIEYLEPEDVSENGTLTICIITVDNGFQVTGISACADPANYRQDIGQKIAYDNAERQLWPLLGFALKEAMAARDVRPAVPEAPANGFAPFLSRKAVECARIDAAEFNADGSGRVALANGDIVDVPRGFLRQPGTLNEGDVLVRYADGYLSWIPLRKFQEPGAYTPRAA